MPLSIQVSRVMGKSGSLQFHRKTGRLFSKEASHLMAQAQQQVRAVVSGRLRYNSSSKRHGRVPRESRSGCHREVKLVVGTRLLFRTGKELVAMAYRCPAVVTSRSKRLHQSMAASMLVLAGPCRKPWHGLDLAASLGRIATPILDVRPLLPPGSQELQNNRRTTSPIISSHRSNRNSNSSFKALAMTC